MPVWKRIKYENTGYLYRLSDALALVEWRYPGVLVPVSDGIMFIASDYSGQHKGASHEAYSFLVTTNGALNKWDPIRCEFRNRWLPDGRRISFKQLREPLRRRALLPFLNAASALRGNVITVLVDLRVGSFVGCAPADLIGIFSDCFSPNTPPRTVEKMFRIASLLAMVTACLRREDQLSRWISDHDETLETFDRREGFAKLASYLTLGLTRWRAPADMDFGTTQGENTPEWIEDATAIADLVAGASCKLSTVLPTHFETEVGWRIISSESEKDMRARTIANWMALQRGPLRQILLRLEVDDHGEIRSTAQFFAGALPQMSIVR
jgi:hypothetical protein